jgi:hypothetical protein
MLPNKADMFIRLYTASFAFFEAIWEAGITHVFGKNITFKRFRTTFSMVQHSQSWIRPSEYYRSNRQR